VSAPVTMQTALQIIRTWAAFERDHPGTDVLVPDHVLKLCDEALGIVPDAGQEAVRKMFGGDDVR
jgi:hypothetical protein